MQTAIVFVVAAMAVTTLMGVTRESTDETRRAFSEVSAIDHVQILAEELVASVRGYLLTGIQEYRDRASDNRRLLDEALATLAEIDPDAPRVAAVQREVEAYERSIEAAVGERERVKDLAALEQLYEQRVAPSRVRLRDALIALQDHHRLHLTEISEDEARITKIVSIAVVLGAALAIGLSIALGIRMGRRLSARYRSEQEAKAQAADAARARKELLDIVSHDLRSPLSTIVLGLELARDRADLIHLDAVENAARRMQRLVDDLLDAARADAHGLDLVLKEVDSEELLRLAAEMFEASAERAGVELRVEHGAHAAMVVDQDRVLQIFSNLVANALKVTPRGGSIVLASEPTEHDVRFTVHDSGPGIPKEEIADLFGAYRQGARRTARGSLGLGLYISAVLAEVQGGRIGVESEPDHGSTFWVELPRRVLATAGA